MRIRPSPLLAELHAHTTWSDGSLTVGELVDLYGSQGFDVLAVTDHVVRTNDPWLGTAARSVGAERHAEYLAELERERGRARRRYDMLVLPGAELTFNDLEPDRAAHAVAVGLERFVPVDDGIEDAMVRAHRAGAAIIAAHPFDDEAAAHPARRTRAFAATPALREHADRFELFNRSTLFGWVSREELPAVATGDFHQPEHLSGWKTLLPCPKRADAVVDYLRSPRPTYLVRVDEGAARLAA